MGATIRTFIAVELPASIVGYLEKLGHELKQSGLNLRWVPPRNIHLTLKFLGNVPESRLPAIVHGLEKGIGHLPSFHLHLHGLGVFPGIRRPRILWVGLGGETAVLAHVWEAVETALSAEGFQRETRPFKPHLTLARMPDRPSRWGDPGRLLQAIEAAGGCVSEPFVCRELVVFKSDLRPQGAVYSAISKVFLDSTQQEGL